MKDVLITDKRLHGRLRGEASVVVTLSGLTDGFAEIGGSAVGYVTNLGQAPDGGVIWSDDPSSAGPATFGTGAAPSDFSSIDGATLYLHLTHEGVTYTRAAAVRQAALPVLQSPPSISGEATEGLTLSGTAASFSGDGLSLSQEWEVSSDGQSWSGTGVTGLTSPVLVLGQYYRLVGTATNTRGSAQGQSATAGPVTQVIPVIQSVTVGAYDPAAGLPITITASDVQAGDSVFWVMVPSADPLPTAQEVQAGQAAGGAAPADSGTGLWPGPFSDVLEPGIPLASYKLCVMSAGAQASDVTASAPFDIETATELVLPADFGVRLFRDATAYIPEFTDGTHELAAFTGAAHVVDAALGSDATGDGSSGAPYATLGHAIAQATAGDRVRLRPGIYATPTSSISTDIALERDGTSGTVLIGRFNDLSTAQVDPTNVAPPAGPAETLWNVDNIAGETFCGFVRLDGAAPGGMRGSAQARTNTFCAQYQQNSICAVFYGGTSANFATGTADTLPDLIAAGHIRAWVRTETQSLTIAAQVYVGPGIVIANNAIDAVYVANGGRLILDRCELYGGSDSTLNVVVNGAVLAFGATIGGSNNDNIHYSTGSIGTEVEVKCLWPGHNETDNASTAHGSAKVLRVNGEYAGGARTIHDIDATEIINVGLTVRDAWYEDQTLMQIGVGGGDTAQLTYGEITFAGTYANTLVVDPGSAATLADLADPWPYS